MFMTSGDSIIRVWSLNPIRLLAHLIGHSEPVQSIQWSADSERILSGFNIQSTQI